MPDPIYVQHVCRRDDGPLECRYLLSQADHPGRFICAKVQPAVKDRIDDLVAHGSRTVTGRAVNCDGHP